MTHVEQRKACIKAIAIAHYNEVVQEEGCDDRFDDAPLEVIHECMKMAAKFLDALNGIARINPIEATEEMEAAVRGFGFGDLKIAFNQMSAKGDLTNPPEKKPILTNYRAISR